ncbi:MAG: carbohydrate ABC transporter substrate-binding protein [Lachnospiraceae bacterium]|nr:carbohydrate ABC transporter substrate-binding protein [Lachnospiraceae bacterium]
MKHLHRKRIIAWLLFGILLILSGCAKGTETSPQDFANTSNSNGTESEAGTDGESGNSMGRYLEQQIELPEEFQMMEPGTMGTLQVLESGEWILVESSIGIYVSADKGETWEQRPSTWLTELAGKGWISHVTVAPNGSVAAIYSISEGEDSSYKPQYCRADADGTEHEIVYTDSEDYLDKLWFGRDNTLYGFSLKGNVYEFDTENGEPRKICQVDGIVDYVCFTETYMIMVTSRGVELYDLEAGTLAQKDEVLQDFIEEETNGQIGSNTGSHLVVMAPGEEKDVVYLALEQGIYRHVIGGTVLEQVADGKLNSLGDPQMYLQTMAALPDNEFVILYNDAKLCHYTYDPNVPTIPEEQLSIYSLEDDYTIRQAVSLYQKKNPGTYIRYETGMTKDSGMTREDAIKNLNTKIMSGSGPDLIVLDGLPADSYKEKGILADLTEIEKGLTGENSLFPNLVDAFREDGKLYSLPIRFRIPLMVGDESVLNGISNLSDFADAMEELRKEQPEGRLTGMVCQDQVLYTLGLASSGAWLTADGKIDEAKLTDFLIQAKRVYDAEIAGYTDTELKEMQDRYIHLWSELEEVTWEDFNASASSMALGIAMKDAKLGIGTAKGMNADFNMISTLADLGDVAYASYPGQMPNSFVPDTCIGISANSIENQLAVNFYRFLFEADLQDLDLPGGYPMNIASFEKQKIDIYADSEGGGISIGSGSEGGEHYSLDIKWVTEENYQRIRKIVDSATTASVSDSIIEQVVTEVGTKAMDGKVSIENAVAEIVKNVAIYLAE